MDSYGSNATPAGGAAGRSDAMIGAVEAQKAPDGVLHVHMFIYAQNVCQFSTLPERSELLRTEMISSEAMKAYAYHVRCASYPDAGAFQQGRDSIERAWPAYASDFSLCTLPSSF